MVQSRELHNEAVRRNAYSFDPFAATHWSHQITELADAFVLPQTLALEGNQLGFSDHRSDRRIYDGGVYTSDGRIVPEAIHFSGGHRHVPSAWLEAPSQPARLKGRWLYGGVLRGHFGHFVTESLGRLWGLDAAEGPFDGIVFLNLHRILPGEGGKSDRSRDRRGAAKASKSYITDTLQLLAGPLPVHVVGRPAQVETLVVPSQMFSNTGAERLAGGHPVFRDFLRKRLAPLGSAGRRRIYISKSKMPPTEESFALETLFERKLSEEGYEIFHPERHPIADQLRTYLSAERIIGVTGSPLHLAAFCMTGRQAVAVLDRERKDLKKFEAQLNSMGARSVTRISAVTGRFRPCLEEDARKLRWKKSGALHVVDLERIWSELRQAGFVSSAASFQDEIEAGMRAELDRIAEARGAPMEIEHLPPGLPRDTSSKDRAVQPAGHLAQLLPA